MSWVYVVQREDGLCKIGYSTNPRERIRLLEREHGDLHTWACIEGNVGVERWLHERWEHAHSHLEWFHPDEDLLRQCDEGRLLERTGGLCKFGSTGSPRGLGTSYTYAIQGAA